MCLLRNGTLSPHWLRPCLRLRPRVGSVRCQNRVSREQRSGASVNVAVMTSPWSHSAPLPRRQRQLVHRFPIWSMFPALLSACCLARDRCSGSFCGRNSHVCLSAPSTVGRECASHAFRAEFRCRSWFLPPQWARPRARGRSGAGLGTSRKGDKYLPRVTQILVGKQTATRKTNR